MKTEYQRLETLECKISYLEDVLEYIRDQLDRFTTESEHRDFLRSEITDVIGERRDSYLAGLMSDLDPDAEDACLNELEDIVNARKDK
jgi:hypothetical protein